MKNNIEDLIRNDFRKREIQPNANAFERLNTKLETHTNIKRKKVIRILGYAASFIGLVFILQSIFNNNNNHKQIITNVKTNDSSSINTVSSKDKTPMIIEQLETLKSIEQPQKTIVINENSITNSQKRLQSKILKPIIIENKLLAVKLVKKGTIEFKDTTKKQIKIKEITDKELDELLAFAYQSLPKKGRDSIDVNAKSMLYEIEVEINKPLPEKVLLTIKTGTNTIQKLIKSNDN